MLVITRKTNESIIINDCIEIVVTGISRDGVRLGINAPREMGIYRREVYESIAEANRSGAGASSALLKAKLAKMKPPEAK
jgi:carbon storage regulator